MYNIVYVKPAFILFNIEHNFSSMYSMSVKFKDILKDRQQFNDVRLRVEKYLNKTVL